MVIYVISSVATIDEEKENFISFIISGRFGSEKRLSDNGQSKYWVFRK